MPKINVVGIGLDGSLGLSNQVKTIIQQATVLGGAQRHLSYFPEHPALKLPLKDLNRDLDLIIDKAATEQVVILASGDPLFFGLGRLLIDKVLPENLQFYPHLSSVQLAFSKLKISWQDADLVSVHGRNCDRLIELLKQGSSKIAVLTDNYNNPPAIAKLYLALELPVNYCFAVCENLTIENGNITYFEHTEVMALSQLTQDNFSLLNVLVLIKQNPSPTQLDLTTLPVLGIPDSAFLSFKDRPSLITKKEVRSIVISELELQHQQVIWDIGAGTGSVSIEVARLSPSATVYAIEKTAIGTSLIQQNAQRFAVANIQVINKKAPESLTDLPTPNRIFIGGSGGNLSSILDTCQTQIATDGIIVIALATVEHFTAVLQWAKQNNWHHHILQVQISRSIPIANLTRFSPLNPISIVKLQKS